MATHDAHAFLEALTIVMCTAGVTTVLCHRARQPVVLGYILAGLIVGPNLPIPLVADRQVVQTLSELGVILLMFSLGLEFSLGKLLKRGPTSAITAVIQSSIMIWLGYMVGRAFGWTVRESPFIIEALAAQSGKESSGDAQLLADVREMLPGLGMPVPVRIGSGSPAVGKTLAELDLRGLTGATVLAIRRGEESILIPTAGEVLRAGDVVALAGTQESVGAAASLLRGAGNLEPVPPS